MFPRFDTVSNKPNGLEVLRNTYNSYYTVPNIINNNFNEGLANEEIESVALVNSIMNDEYIAADELGGEKQSLSELNLDEDFLGNTLLRKSLGYLSEGDSMDIEDFAEGTEGNTRNNFLKVMKGKTDEVLKGLKEKESRPDSFKLFSYFTPAIDPETGKYTLKQVVGTKESMAKVELAGTSIINSYGPKKLTSNALLGFTESFARGLHGILPGIYSFAAGAGDIAEAVSSLAKGEGYKSEYDSLNALADYRQEEITRDTPYGKTSVEADQSMFDNLESFSNVMGNVMSSLVSYAGVGRAIANTGVGSLIGGLAATGKEVETLGTIGKTLNEAIKSAPTVLPMVGAGMVLNYGEAYQAARDAGLSLEDAASVGLLTGAINTVIEQKLGSNALTRWLATGKSGKMAAQAVVNETGGDVSKLFDRGISNRIINNIVNAVDRFTATNKIGVGSAFEEGLEEFLQSEAKNSIEVLYDQFIAPEDVEIGKGKFGTELFSKESFKSALEEGAAGAIAGLLGGFVHSKVKEDRSIVPFIASGEYESLMAGMNMALTKGAITQQQYDGIKSRAEVLNTLYTDNKDLFARVASYDPKNQMEISEAVLKQLRNQDDYIQNTKNGLEDDYKQFVDILNDSSRVVTVNNKVAEISTVDRFERALRESGRTEEADIISSSKKDAKDKINKILPKPKKFESEEQRRAWLQTRQNIENSIYTIDANRQINNLRNRKLNGEINSLLSNNNDLKQAVEENFTSNVKYTDTLNEKYDAIRKAADENELKKAIEDARNFVIKHAVNFENRNSQITNIHDYAIKQAQLANNAIDEVVDIKRLKDLTTDKDYVKSLYDKRFQTEKVYSSIKAIEDKLAAIEKKTKAVEDYFSSDDYKTSLDSVINDPNTSEDTLRLYTSAKEGDTGSQLEIAEAQKKQLIRDLNKLPVSAKEERSNIKSLIDDKDFEINYLRDKKTKEDEEIAKSIPNPVDADFSNVNDKVISKDGKEFTIDKKATKKSEKYGFVYTLNDKDGKPIEVGQGELLNYNIESKSGGTISLAQLAAEQNKLLEDASPRQELNLKEGQNEDYEITNPKSKLAKDYAKDDTYKEGVRLASDDKFNAIINNPSTDVSKFAIDFTISDNIENLSGYAKEKAAKKKYLTLLKSSNPIEALDNLSEVERNELIQYLPIQGIITNKGYSNKVFAFSNASKEKTKLVLELLKNKGNVKVPAGNIVRTPGYNNYQPNTSNTLVKGLGLKLNKDGEYVFPNGTPMRIGIADATNSIFYIDPSRESEYLLTANATGTPGSPYLIIPGKYQLTGEEGYVAKLNPNKIPLELATSIARVFADLSSRKIRLKDAIPADNTYGIEPVNVGYLTYAQFLNSLVYFGESTVNSKREPSKILYFDTNNSNIVRFGAKHEALRPNDEDSIAKFAKWMSVNKNFAISRAMLNNDMPVKYGFKIKAGNKIIDFKSGARYLNTIIDNDFLSTDLDISKGLISKSYLVVQNIPITERVITTDSIPSPKEEKTSEVFEKEEIVFKSVENLSEKINNLPDGSTITAKIPGAQKYANKAALVKQGTKLVSLKGEELLNIEGLNEEELSQNIRKALVDVYNKSIDDLIKYESEHPEAQEKVKDEGKLVTVDKTGLKIYTQKTVTINKQNKQIENPRYYEAIKKATIAPPKTVKPSAESKRKETAKPEPKNTNTFGLLTNNPFDSVEQTEEVKKLREVYDRLIDNLSTLSSKLMYDSAVRSLLTKRKAIPSANITKEELSNLLDYTFPDGNTVSRILLNLGKVIPVEAPQQISPVKTVPEKVDEKATDTEKPLVEITKETSPFKLGAYAKDATEYQNLVNEYRNNFDQMDSDEMIDFLSRMNDQISDSIPNFEIYNDIRKGTLKLRERKIKESPVKEAPVANAPLDPRELNKAAGITDEMIGFTRKKPKNKFTTFGKKPSVSMQVYDNVKQTSDLEKELLNYRRMLGKRAGGNIKLVDQLIRIIGESGRPGWAWSIMNEDGVTLFERPAAGAAYHEAFHRVSLLLLSPEEQARMYNLARKEYSLFNRNDNEVEEFLAERFREDVINDAPDSHSKLGRVISDIKNFIKSFLGLNKTKIDNIDGFFNSIKNGKYKFAKINKAALTNFNQRYANADAPLTVNGVTLHQIYNSSLLGNIVSTLTSMTIDVNGVQNIESLEKGLSFKAVKDQLIDIRDKHLAASQNEAFGELERAIYEEKVDLYNEILDNFDTVFRPLIDVKLQGFNIRRVESKLEEKDDLNDLVNDEIRSAYEFSAKENAQADIRVMFLTLKDSETLDPETFLPVYINPDVAWFNAFSAIHNAKSIDEMLELLKKKADETSTIRQAKGDSSKINMYSELYEILTTKDENGNEDEMLKTRFWNTFKKHRNRFINAYFGKDTNDKGKELTSYTITYGDADVNKRSNRLEQNWSATFGVNGTFANKNVLQQAIADYKELKNKSKKHNFLKNDYAENVLELVRILNNVNIAVDGDAIGVLLNNHYFNSNLNVALKNLINGVPRVGSKDPVGLDQLFGEQGLFYNLVNDKIEDVTSHALNLLSKEKSVAELAKAYVAANPTAEDDSVLGPDGNLVYAYSENNTITSMFEEWLKDDSFFTQINGVTYNKSSFWLQQMTDPKVRSNVHVDTMLSMIDKDGYDTGRGYLDIAPNEDLLLKFNAVRNNRLPLPTLANKRTFYFITGLNRQEVTIQNGSLNKETIDLFVNYAINEYSTIQAAINAKNNFLNRLGVSEESWNKMSKIEQDSLMKEKDTNYKELVENYHYIVKGGAMRLTGNGYKFRYFSSLQNKLSDDKFFDINSKGLRKVIEESLIQQVNNTIKQFINQKLINGNEKYLDDEFIKENDSKRINTNLIFSNRLLPASIVKQKVNEKIDLAEAIADYAINSAIAVYEFEKLVSGDVAFYKGSEDYQAMLDDRVKRYSALTSTKSVLRENWPEGFLDFDTHKYKTAIFNSNIVESRVMYNEMMSKYVGTDDNHGLLWKQFEMFRERRVGRFADMTDEQLKEEVVKEADKRLNGYLETDQTDAQVLISPKMFRKLAIMNGEWNGEKEEAYNLMESDEPLSLEDELYAYSVVMQPLKYIHFGYDFINGLQIPIYDKMSLATVFKRVAKGRDLQKVYDLMNDKDVDMIKFDTSVKSGLRQKGTFYVDGKPNTELQEIPVYEQSFKYLGKQLVTDPHHVSRISLGTQMAKIGVAGVEDNDVYEYEGVKYSGKQLIDDYVGAISALSDIGRNNIYEQFGISEITENGKTYMTVNRDKFVQMLKDDAINSNLPSNLIDVLKTIENEDGNKDYYIELSGIPALAWIQSRIISMIKKETIDINTPGGSMIQMSNFAYKDSFAEVDTSKYEYKFNKELRFKDENNRLQAIVSINLFKDVLPKDYLLEQAKKNNTSYFEEAKKFILDNQDLAVLSYRIPTQGMNSTLPITIVDVLPSNVGDTIVLPAELTKLTGADFDVDKMYLARYNYDVIGGKLYKTEFIDDYVGLDELGNPIYLNEEEYLKKVYDHRYRWFNTDFYKQAKVEIPKILQSVLVDINRNGELTEDSINILNSMKNKYSIFIGQRKFNQILRDPELAPNKKILKLASSFKFEDRKMTFEEFVQENSGKNKWQLNDHRQIENRLLDVFQTTLTSSNHYMDATVPLDFATDALKEAVKVVDSYSNINKNYNNLEPLFPLYQENVKTQNVGADAGIGPMALINTFRVIMQIAKLDLDKTIEISRRRGKVNTKRNLFSIIPNIGNLYDKFDANGISIMDWTSALINAHVDAAKDSYITRLNVNSYTYDVVALLTSSGVGLNQFYFLPQPVLKEIANESIRRGSSKMGLTKKERNDKRWKDSILNKYEKAAKLDKKNFYSRLDDGTLTIEWNGNTYNVKDLVFNAEWLKEQLRDHYNKNFSTDWYRNQVIIYEYFTDIQNYSKALSNMVLASQVDTGKMGKNQAELILSLHNIERMMDDPHFTNAEDVYNKTFLGRKLNNSTGLLFDLLKNEMIEFSPGFLKMVNKFGELSNTYYDRKSNNITKYMSEMKFAMQAEFFNEYCKRNNINLKDMFYGNNTIVDRVDRLRNQILTGTRYLELSDNMLLKMLIPGINVEGKPKKFETVLKLRDTDAKNAYTYAWRDLLEHSSEEVRNIAKDLIIYSFYTSGGRGTGIYATLDLVPFEVLGNLSYTVDGVDYTYNQHLKDLLKRSNDNSLDFNKYMDYAFRALQGVEDIVQSATPNRQQLHEGQTVYITTEQGDYNTTTGLPVPYLQYNNTLFKLVGRLQNETDYYPVYAATNSINFKERGFTINEGTTTSFIDGNQRIDATDLSIEFEPKFLQNEMFVPIDNPFDVINSETTDITEDNDEYRKPEENIQVNAIPTTKIISGGQTGIDRLGLEMGRELGLETGGTTTPGYYTENGPDTSLQDFGVTEIDPELQAGRKGKEFYLPRTEQNVINSDGTVYFSTDEDSAGRIATQRFAKAHNKPFLLNPTSQELAQWLVDNNIGTLNVAGNRGSKVSPEFDSQVRGIIRNAFKSPTQQNLFNEFNNSKEFPTDEMNHCIKS